MIARSRSLAEWHEDNGPVLWWKFPLTEPPYVGTPNDCGQTIEITVKANGIDKVMRAEVGGWPGYHTHWTPIPTPAPPLKIGAL